MKLLIIIIGTFFVMNFSFGQNFSLNYWTIGLGSNAAWHMPEEYKDCASGLKVEIKDTVFSYSICERTKRYKIYNAHNDTIRTKKRNFYNISFRQSSIDSIILFLDTLKGKYVYKTNPRIWSGGIYNISIEKDSWCSQFVMKNMYDSTALLITNLINTYLDEKYRINVPDSRWMRNKYDKPLIENCPKHIGDSYREVLKQEYDVIIRK